MCIPFAHRAIIDAPLHVIAAAAARLHLPRGYPLALEQQPPPSGYMRVSLWPAQLRRAAIGLAVAARNQPYFGFQSKQSFYQADEGQF